MPYDNEKVTHAVQIFFCSSVGLLFPRTGPAHICLSQGSGVLIWLTPLLLLQRHCCHLGLDLGMIQNQLTRLLVLSIDACFACLALTRIAYLLVAIQFSSVLGFCPLSGWYQYCQIKESDWTLLAVLKQSIEWQKRTSNPNRLRFLH